LRGSHACDTSPRLGVTRDKIGINKQNMYMNMQKKEYLMPALEVVEMECVSILAMSVELGDDIENGTTETKKHDGPFTHTWE
jgi:hypothetical protein